MNTDITVWTGNTFPRKTWVLLDESEDPRALTGYTFNLVAKNKATGTVALDFSVTDDDGLDGPLQMVAAEGKVTFGLTWDETVGLPEGRFDLELQEISPDDVRLIAGRGTAWIRQSNFDG